MNRKQLISLVVIGVVVAVLWVVTQKKEQSEYRTSSEKMGQKLLPDLAVNDVTTLSFKQAKSELNLAQTDNGWVVKERGDYPADFASLRELLIKFSELKVAKPISSPRLAQLELLPLDKSPSTLVEFKDAKGKSLSTLLLGAKHMRETESPYGNGPMADGRYVMVENDEKKVALINDALNNAEPKASEWLNKDWFKVENLRSITITSTNATNSWKLSKESETNEWKLADIKADEHVDTAKLAQITTALSSPIFNDLATNSAPDATGLDKPLLAKLETADGFTYDVKVGNKVGEDDYYMQVVVSAALAKERAPGKDEKPEDTAKLDKAFNEKRIKLEQKLKVEKAFEKWTYIVGSWTIDPLLKERKDLMVEKKEEPKIGEGAPKAGELNLDNILNPMSTPPAPQP